MESSLDDVGLSNIHIFRRNLMRILMIGPIEKAGGVSTHTKMLVKELKNKGIDVEFYNTYPKKEHKIKLINNLVKLYKKSLGVSFKILKYYRKADLVHIQSSGPLGGFISAIFASLLKTIFKYKLVITFHYAKIEEFVKRYGKIMNFVFLRSTLLFTVAKRNKELILKYSENTYENKIVVIPNGYDPETFRVIDKNFARELLNLPMNCRIIVNVANLLEHKGHKYLLEAMDIIVNKAERKNVRCIIIGRGPLYNHISEIIQNLNLTKYIILTGWIPDQKLLLFLNAADLFIFTSLSESESFGIVQIEAMACGKPVVATKNGGSEEILISEEYGLLCEPANPKELAEKTLIALDKEWDKDKIMNYVQRFTWENIANKTIGIYNLLV